MNAGDSEVVLGVCWVCESLEEFWVFGGLALDAWNCSREKDAGLGVLGGFLDVG